jgi:glycosyltransferase involved in cell wall biosynthesis
VHAMRIPYEGMLAVLSRPAMPLLVSVWGNDFTLHAPATPLMKRYTRQVLSGTQALHTDCHRDMDLAREWGFAADKPGVVLPGAGGIQLDLFHPSAVGNSVDTERNRTVINPRGFRAYVRSDTFFRSIPVVLEQQSDICFLCTTMAHEPQANRWVKELGISENVELLPRQTRPQMAELFRSARLAVSPSLHDGTPNTLLEAMACGCLPAAGDIPSLREWITPGLNGLLFDPNDHHALAAAILQGLRDDELYIRAQEYNRRLVTERAAYESVMAAAEAFYGQIIK